MGTNYLLQSVALVSLVGAVSSSALAQSGTSDFRVINPSSMTDSQRANYLAQRETWLKGASVNGQPVTLVGGSSPSTVATVAGRVVVATPTSISVGGKSVPVIQSIKATAAATGKLAVALAKVAGPVGVAVAAYNLFEAVDGFKVQYNGPVEPLDVKRVADTSITKTCYSALSFGQTTCYSKAELAAILEPLYHSSRYAGFGAVPFEECQGQLSYVFWWSLSDRPSYFQKSCPAAVAVRENVEPVRIFVPSTEQALLDAIAARDGWPSGVVEDTIKAGLENGLPLEVDETSKEISGPASAPGATTTTNNPDGSTTTNTTTNHMTYQGDNVTHNLTTVSQTCTGVGACQTTTSTTTNVPADKSDPDTCGLPGKPACKMDEAGTPSAVDEGIYVPKLDQYKADAGSLRDKAAGSADKPFFTGWAAFFGAPAMAACEPIALPSFQGGASMGTLDPCPVVSGVREVMAYIWALAGLIFSLSMVKGVV